MKITEDVRKIAAASGVEEGQVVVQGLAEKSAQFAAQGGELYARP